MACAPARLPPTPEPVLDLAAPTRRMCPRRISLAAAGTAVVGGVGEDGAMLTVAGVPFPFRPSDPDAWRLDGHQRLVADAPPHTDLYVDPSGEDLAGTGSTVAPPTLLAGAPEGDFLFSARVRVDFRSTYDAGVLLLYSDDRTWAKLCFERSPSGPAMVVSVVTLGVSDDANAFDVSGASVWLRIARIDRVHAFHASTDGLTWRLVRVFRLGDRRPDVGFEAQSPTGEGCTVIFDEIRYVPGRLADPRDGS